MLASRLVSSSYYMENCVNFLSKSCFSSLFYNVFPTPAAAPAVTAENSVDSIGVGLFAKVRGIGRGNMPVGIYVGISEIGVGVRANR